MSEIHSFTITAYPVYAVRVLVEAATPQEAIDKACEAIDWNAPKRSGLPGAEWVEFSDGWECFNVSGDGAVEWRGPDGRTPLPDPRVLQNAQALADGLQQLVTHAAGLYGVMPQEARHLSLILRPAVRLLHRVGAAAPEGLRRLLEPCEHDWQPTDSKGHSMECVRCGGLWTLAEGEVVTLIIEDVDMGLLEEQRLSLGAATVRAGDKGLHLTPDETFALTGIVNMLDAWSDERAGEV